MKKDAIAEGMLYDKAYGCLLGGLIGDAIGTPIEGLDYREIEQRFGWVDDFSSDGTDDTVMKNLLAEALIRTDGYATADDWAEVWLDQWGAIFGSKQAKFFVSVIHTAQKLRHDTLPRMAALGNMPSSSSAMCISPVGVVNACHPEQAARQAYDLGSLIHIHDVGYCQDGAAAIAAAVAEAMSVEASVESILEAASRVIVRISGQEMRSRIATAVQLARAKADYAAFRAAVYADAERFFCRIGCDSRETVPLTLALFYLADGDVEKAVTYAANLGRDADTIASMCGAIAGAWRGVQGIKSEWVSKVQQVAGTDQAALAARLAQVAVTKHRRELAAHSRFEALSR